MQQESKTSRQAMIEAASFIKARRDNPGTISGISSWGYPTLDQMTGGIQPGELTGLGARPAIGKSSWLNVPIQEVTRTFRDAGRGTVARGVILEMSVREFALRQICAIAMVPQGKVREGRINDEEHERLRAAARELAGLPIEYVDFQTPISEIERFLRKDGRCGWWFVDHLGILPGANATTNKSTLIAGFVDELTRFAKEIAPGLIVVPLNRNAEARQDPHPMLSDFRDSSQIESNLQLAIGLYRNLKEAARPENRNRPQAGDMEIMKQRNGPNGRIYMLFDGPRTLWYEDDERNQDISDAPAQSVPVHEAQTADEEMEF